MKFFYELARLLRPYQWLKNSFVLVGLIFGNNWHDISIVYHVIGATLAFCLLSSCVYIFNDIIDLHADQLHPVKSKRPLAAGTITITHAATAATLLGAIAGMLGFYISLKLGIILLSYVSLNISYSLWLKHIVIVDVFAISLGFMLRILAGTIGVGIPPSHWLILCGFMFTLFLGFSKRYIEYKNTNSNRRFIRKSLAYYSTTLLETLMGITATGTIVVYSLYTLNPDIIRIHHTANLIYTSIFVIYGIFRYIYLLYKNANLNHMDISTIVLRDSYLLITLTGWLLLTIYLVS